MILSGTPDPMDQATTPDTPALRARLRQLRAGLVWSAVGRRLAVAGSVAPALFSAAAVADWYWELPLGIRKAALATNGTVVALLVGWAAAAVVTGVAAWRTRNLGIAIAAGMLAFWALRWVSP